MFRILFKINKMYQIIIVLALLSAAAPAYAYLDPGTGSAILQGVIGGLAAIAVVVKLYWHRLMRLFGLRKHKDEMPPDSDVVKPQDQ